MTNALALLGRIWQVLADVLAALRQNGNAISALQVRVAQLEERMAAESDVIARIDSFTSHLGQTVSNVAQELKDLRTAIESGNQAAVDAAMGRLGPSIDNLEAVGAQLDALASDPGNPIPDPGPGPGPEPGPGPAGRFRR